MAPVSNHDLCSPFAINPMELPGKRIRALPRCNLTRDIPVARVSLQKLHANVAAGPRRTSVRRGLFFLNTMGHKSDAFENLGLDTAYACEG